jgi:PIN domain nuclease of toxin-antitoxin system
MILLDTHAVLWFVGDPDRLGRGTTRAIQAEHRVCFSAAVQVEVTVKRMIDRIDAPPDLHLLLVEQGLEELPVTAAHAAAMERFPLLARHDPFDRLMLAQAAVEQARLVTADRRLLDLGLEWVLDAGD